MRLPLILLCGRAGSGKDTVSGIMASEYRAASVAQADPMKRFCHDVFQFTEDQLWGPSELRDTPDDRYVPDGNPTLSRRMHEDARFNFEGCHRHWLEAIGIKETPEAVHQLRAGWFNGCMDLAGRGLLSPRLALQTLGTEFGRRQDRQVWVRGAQEAALLLIRGGYRYHRLRGVVASDGPYPDYVTITDGRFRNEVVGVLERGGEAWSVTGRARDLPSGGGHRSENELSDVPDHLYAQRIDNSGTLDDLRREVARALSSSFGDRRRTELDAERLMRRAGG